MEVVNVMLRHKNAIVLLLYLADIKVFKDTLARHFGMLGSILDLNIGEVQ